MVGVSQNFVLRRVALAPVPFLLQFVRERIGILHALDVAACPRVAVPVPGAADVAALLIDPHRQSLPAQSVQHVHSGKARADYDDIVSFSACGVAFAGNGLHGGHSNSPKISLVLRSAFYPRRESARAKTTVPGCIFCHAECAMNDSRHTAFPRRLRARPGTANPLGFDAHDGLASPENSKNSNKV